ncbi:polysaccharide pyruvyl transferase family protein [Flavobacterium sp. RSSB_23]|uniref:polysaccharide pyruvyl transferase family protein n=1 Tax=Flavobacterium sp. RSSB_23 TaxID=3447668 RepID=UPI003F2FB920
MAISSIFSSLQKTISSKIVLNTIARNSQENNGIVNIHRIDEKNIGDYYCAPHHYFDQLKESLDIFDYKSLNPAIKQNYIDSISQNSLVIGGGGLLNRGSFDKQMHLFEKLSQKNKKMVLWGLGHNEKNPKAFGKVTKYNIDTQKFGLVGVRDYDMKEEWVPCASCLHPILDTKSEVINEIGLIFHKKTLNNPKVLGKFKNYPSTSNTTSLEDIISFIAKTDTVVTDSYHAMYWSMLMNKKVVVFPNSSKFFTFKYQPVFSSIDTFKLDCKKAQNYSGILEECRDINLKFSEKAFDYLGY